MCFLLITLKPQEEMSGKTEMLSVGGQFFAMFLLENLFIETLYGLQFFPCDFKRSSFLDRLRPISRQQKLSNRKYSYFGFLSDPSVVAFCNLKSPKTSLNAFELDSRSKLALFWFLVNAPSEL